MGAEVTLFDLQPQRLEAMRELGANVTALYPYRDAIAEAVARTDLLIGAILVPGAKAPRLVSRAQVLSMERGSVVVDVAVDQGGCIETIRPTSYLQPTYEVEGITHFGVTNMPGGVPRSASKALCASLLPYLLRLAEPDWREEPALMRGLNLEQGRILHPALA
jgi:alanine dehydrogenase